MKPNEREDNLYKSGKRCQISCEELVLFEYLLDSEKFSPRAMFKFPSIIGLKLSGAN